MNKRAIFAGLSIAVVAMAIMLLLVRGRWTEVTHSAPHSSSSSSRYDKLDPALLVSRKGMLDVVSAAQLPCADKIAPIYTEYWDTKSAGVMIEPMPAREIVDKTDPITWHAWTTDGKGILYSTSSSISLYDTASGRTKRIIALPRIDLRYLSPDRQKIAIANADELLIVNLAGRRLGKYSFGSAILSAAWSPDSSRIACTTRDRVWLITSGMPTRELIRHRSMKDTLAEPTKWRRVERVDSVSWSASGSDLAYCAHTKGECGYKPYIMVLNLATGRSRLVREGYSEEDKYHCWAPVGDWMLACGGMGEVDTYIGLYCAWSDENYQVDCGGASAGYHQLSWQPRSSSFAVNTWFIPGAEVVEPLYTISIMSVDPKVQYYIKMSGGEKVAGELARKIASVNLPRVESKIPDFDWAPDGSRFVHIERLCSIVQWRQRHDLAFPGKPFVQMKIQSGNGNQYVLLWDGQSPSMPRFSDDGSHVSYLVDGDIRICDIQTAKRSRSAAESWLSKGRDMRKSGDLVGAVYALRNSIRHSPGKRDTHRELAQIYTELARKEPNPYRKYNLIRAALFESQTADGETGDFSLFLQKHLL